MSPRSVRVAGAALILGCLLTLLPTAPAAAQSKQDDLVTLNLDPSRHLAFDLSLDRDDTASRAFVEPRSGPAEDGTHSQVVIALYDDNNDEMIRTIGSVVVDEYGRQSLHAEVPLPLTRVWVEVAYKGRRVLASPVQPTVPPHDTMVEFRVWREPSGNLGLWTRPSIGGIYVDLATYPLPRAWPSQGSGPELEGIGQRLNQWKSVVETGSDQPESGTPVTIEVLDDDDRVLFRAHDEIRCDVQADNHLNGGCKVAIPAVVPARGARVIAYADGKEIASITPGAEVPVVIARTDLTKASRYTTSRLGQDWAASDDSEQELLYRIDSVAGSTWSQSGWVLAQRSIDRTTLISYRDGLPQRLLVTDGLHISILDLGDPDSDD